jgi:glutaredoxin 3
MFTWEPSPSCIQAKKAMDLMGITDQVLEFPLDKPWSEGNPIRAELGKMVGRSSVPAIFIGGHYVGGFDGGISKDDAPGIQAMAFQGTLRPALEAAGIAFPKKS